MGIPGITDRIRIRDQRVEVRGGGGCLSVIGVLFLFAGCAPIVALICGALGLGDEPVEYVVVPVVSLAIIALGVLAVFARLRFDIDGNSRTYRRRFSIIKTIKEKSGSLDEFDRVTLSRMTRRRSSGKGSSSTHTVYPIQLVGDGESLDVWEPQNLSLAKDQAEQIAKALGFTLADRTGPTEVVREADHLDESLRDQRRRTGESFDELPPPPEGMKTQFRIEGEGAVLEIPPGGFGPAARKPLSFAVGIIPFSLIVFGFLWFFLGSGEKPDTFEIAFSAFFVLLGVLLPIYICVHMFLRAVVVRYIVRVSAEALHVTTRGLLLSRVSEIPANELEELRIVKPRNSDEPMEEAEIVARSDRTTIGFGHNLPPEEKEWVKTVLERVLTT